MFAYIAYESVGAFSFMRIVRQPPPVRGFTHASSVIPPVRRRDVESLIVTSAFVPLNDSALPAFPSTHAAPETTPALLFVD